MTRRDHETARRRELETVCTAIRARTAIVLDGLANLAATSPFMPTQQPKVRVQTSSVSDPTGSTVTAAEAWLKHLAARTATALEHLDGAAALLRTSLRVPDTELRWLRGPAHEDDERPRYGWISTATATPVRLDRLRHACQQTVDETFRVWTAVQDDPADPDRTVKLGWSLRGLHDCEAILFRVARDMNPSLPKIPVCKGCGRVNRPLLEGTSRHRECRTCQRRRAEQKAA